MCDVGKRCASYLKTKIRSMTEQEDASTEHQMSLNSLRMQYYGTPTGQKEIDGFINKTEDPKRVQELRDLKTKAKHLRDNQPSLSRAEQVNNHVREVKEAKERLHQQYDSDTTPVNHTHVGMTSKEIEKYNERFRVLNEKLTEDEKKSIKSYTEILYDAINLHLRNPKNTETNLRMKNLIDAP